jgi:Flp pilus assembly pilin Flp
MGRVRDLVVDESGQDFVEYGVALAIIALGAAAAAVVVADDVGSIWQTCMETIKAVLGG